MTEQPILLNTYPKKGETNVEHYEFEPIKGYPMLNWKGKRPFTSTQFFPSQLKEVYGEPVEGWRNKLFWGDNLQVMSHLLKDFRGKFKMVYIDPPFASDADYKKKITLKGKTIANDHNSFEEKQYSDIWSNDEYLQFIFQRLILIRELISDDGCVFVHCDWRMNSSIRLILDEIFGKNNFVNEIIWSYRSGGASKKESLPKKHDTILLYRKNQFEVNTIYERQYLEKPFMGSKTDENGKFYVDTILRDIFEGVIICPDSEGNLRKHNTRPVLNLSSERLDYPTQKPEGLLELVIEVSTKAGDLVADFFCGSGTTLSVAQRLGRRFIGADINVGSIQTVTRRLIDSGINYIESQPLLSDKAKSEKSLGIEIYNVNNYELFRNPTEAKELIINAMEIQRFDSGQLYDGEKDGRLIKIMPINRIATRADISDLIAGFDYKSFDRRQAQNPGKPVEKITLVCMGHEPDLAAYLKNEVLPYNIDVEVVDILRDKQDLQFKRDSEAKVVVKNNQVVIEAFYPMNLLQKLSMQQENVTDWRELVEAILVDWNYDGAVLQPTVVDIPEGNDLVKGKYPIPKDAGTIRVKITDLLSESLEVEVENG